MTNDDIDNLIKKLVDELKNTITTFSRSFLEDIDSFSTFVIIFSGVFSAVHNLIDDLVNENNKIEAINKLRELANLLGFHEILQSNIH